VLAIPPSVPSIPTGKTNTELTGPGESPKETTAIQVYTGEKGDTVGPDVYNVQEQMTTRAARQPDFGKKSGRKALWTQSCDITSDQPDPSIPGPGSYDGKKRKPEKRNDWLFKSNTALPCNAKPGQSALQPGPGTYASEEVTQAFKKPVVKEHNQFGSTVRRGDTWMYHSELPFTERDADKVPGPGKYAGKPGKLPDFKSTKKPRGDDRRGTFYGVHHPNQIFALADATRPLNAFNSTEIRACNKPGEQVTPGPQEYSIDVCIGSSISASVKAKNQVGRRGAFGSTSARFHGFALAPRNEVDGGKYDPRAKSSEKDFVRSSFQSQRPRGVESVGPKDPSTVKLGKDQLPGPGDYRPEPVNYSNPYRTPKTDHLGFGSAVSAARFDPRFVFHNEPVKLVPGPGEYETPAVKSRTAAEAKRGRFANDGGNYLHGASGSTGGAVGPGTYEVATSLVRKTYNVTTEATVPLEH